MKKRRLGNSDLMVSEICMGCMGFGDPTRGQHTWTLDEKSSREIIIQGLEAGINFFDTAIAYQSGTSEKYLGKTIREVSNRDDVIIATKFLPKNDEEIEKGNQWYSTCGKYVEQKFGKLRYGSCRSIHLSYVGSSNTID
jgi:aryl-alcohol dehydrogenase-like predicted oxidoreductase